MHEVALATELIRLAEAHAAGAPIRRVVVLVGALVGVEPQSLAFCYETLTRGTLAEGSRLVLEEVPARARCRTCQHAFGLGQRHEPCPSCGGHELEILAGRELRIQELEVA